MADPTRPGGPDRSAAGLLRSVGLLADGPVVWGRPIPGRGPGVYLVELPGPAATAPLELTRIGKWIERLPDLRLDGEETNSKALAARLSSLWLPEARVLYIGSTEGSLGARVAGLSRHVLGDPRPHADGQWLYALRRPEDLRIWWATTRAPLEYLDGLLDAFAAGLAPLPTRPAGALMLPWANLRRPTGERQQHGITGSTLPLPVEAVAPPTRRVEVPAGDADGTSREDRGSGTRRRSGDPASLGRSARVTGARPAAGTVSRVAGTTQRPRTPVQAAKASRAKAAPVPMSEAAIERLRVEIDELTRLRRPEVVARIKAARELGDLRENSEYHAAREEQSFLEGRVQMLEERLRNAVPLEDQSDAAGSGLAAAPRVRQGSIVIVEHDGEELHYTIVGTSEADPAAGRISTASPVGAALLGAHVGDAIEVRTPRGPVSYRVVAIE